MYVGEEVNLEDGVPGLVNQLFEDNDISVSIIVAKLNDNTLNREENVDDYYRLYILLAFATFYFPRSYRIISTFPFVCLDNLQNLHIYNWGGSYLWFAS